MIYILLWFLNKNCCNPFIPILQKNHFSNKNYFFLIFMKIGSVLMEHITYICVCITRSHAKQEIPIYQNFQKYCRAEGVFSSPLNFKWSAKQGELNFKTCSSTSFRFSSWTPPATPFSRQTETTLLSFSIYQTFIKRFLGREKNIFWPNNIIGNSNRK